MPGCQFGNFNAYIIILLDLIGLYTVNIALSAFNQFICFICVELDKRVRIQSWYKLGRAGLDHDMSRLGTNHRL